MIIFFTYLMIFLLGLVFGSFLNCMIYRLELEDFSPEKYPKEKKFSLFAGRSFCPNCQHILGWQDLIPLISFFILKRKCRYCKKAISWQYPLVEISTGLIFLLIFNFQFSISNQFLNFNFLNLFYYLIIACFLIVIFIYDLKHYIIPDKIIYTAISVSTIWYLVYGILLNHYTSYNILHTIYSAVGAATFFLLIVLLSKGKWMGIGDIKLAFFMGLILGWPNIALALFLAFFIGAIVGVLLILLRKKEIKSEIPFGPFLVTATFLSFLWGKEIINWYFNFFLI